ncbi:hypothetical protein NE237_021017 [Protea cynaroides]|uniref:Uncharacterized protein n=1 Tax=Protea cynaroides TaxID=273540 RepID=A0A9Q0HBP1_9MAGN|nr:hypothetical protein NE237_021017 [Protea cynaroides]
MGVVSQGLPLGHSIAINKVYVQPCMMVRVACRSTGTQIMLDCKYTNGGTVINGSGELGIPIGENHNGFVDMLVGAHTSKDWETRGKVSDLLEYGSWREMESMMGGDELERVAAIIGEFFHNPRSCIQLLPLLGDYSFADFMESPSASVVIGVDDVGREHGEGYTCSDCVYP